MSKTGATVIARSALLKRAETNRPMAAADKAVRNVVTKISAKAGETPPGWQTNKERKHTANKAALDQAQSAKDKDLG